MPEAQIFIVFKKFQFFRDNQVFWNMYCEENGELCTDFDSLVFLFLISRKRKIIDFFLLYCAGL